MQKSTDYEDKISLSVFDTEIRVIDATLTMADRRKTLQEQRRLLGTKTFLEMAYEIDTQESQREKAAAQRKIERNKELQKQRASQDTPISHLERAVKSRIEAPQALNAIAEQPKKQIKELFEEFCVLRRKRGIVMSNEDMDFTFNYLTALLNRPEPSTFTRLKTRITQRNAKASG